MKNNHSLTDWLNDLENRHHDEIQLGLVRVISVADKLDLRSINAKVITVAGTNGKGSTVATLEAIYHAAGYQVASYTSPHLHQFNERIRINLEPVSDQVLCDAFDHIEANRADVPLTYFEMTTLAALWIFKHKMLDIIILEVGMGGRLDATNAVDADLAIITTVDLDHQAYLGDTIEAIAAEKAGIIRANKPCIYADYNPPKSIVHHAVSLNAKLYSLGVDFSEMLTSQINPKAASAAVFASQCLQEVLPVNHEHLALAMKNVKIQGRQQFVVGNISTLYDVAHNPQAVSLLAQCIENYLSHLENKDIRIHAVFSGLQDKDLCGLIGCMKSYVHFWYPCVLSTKRAASEQLLLKAFHQVDLPVKQCFDSPVNAYRNAIKQATQGDLILVYGSFFVVSVVQIEQGVGYEFNNE